MEPTNKKIKMFEFLTNNQRTGLLWPDDLLFRDEIDYLIIKECIPNFHFHL